MTRTFHGIVRRKTLTFHIIKRYKMRKVLVIVRYKTRLVITTTFLILLRVVKDDVKLCSL